MILGKSITLEQIRIVVLRVILQEDYECYAHALEITGLDSLKMRRVKLCLTFAQNCVKSEKSSDMFPVNKKSVNTRPHEKYFVTPASTNRLAKSAIPYMQRLLNNAEK